MDDFILLTLQRVLSYSPSRCLSCYLSIFTFSWVTGYSSLNSKWFRWPKLVVVAGLVRVSSVFTLVGNMRIILLTALIIFNTILKMKPSKHFLGYLTLWTKKYEKLRKAWEDWQKKRRKEKEEEEKGNVKMLRFWKEEWIWKRILKGKKEVYNENCVFERADF